MDHKMEVQHQEVRDGKIHLVLGCNSCGRYKEYKMALAQEKKQNELNFMVKEVV